MPIEFIRVEEAVPATFSNRATKVPRPPASRGITLAARVNTLPWLKRGRLAHEVAPGVWTL